MEKTQIFFFFAVILSWGGGRVSADFWDVYPILE